MKLLYVHVDESGQFSLNKDTSEYYIIGMVFHEENPDLDVQIRRLNDGMKHLGVEGKQIHTGPLIRRKFDFEFMNIEWRRRIFNTMFSFFRTIDVFHESIVVGEKHVKDDVQLTALLSKKLHSFLMDNIELFVRYDKVVVFYDNAQVELKRIISSIFGSVLNNVEFEREEPVESRLFQVADLCVTLKLLSVKSELHKLSKSEYVAPATSLPALP